MQAECLLEAVGARVDRARALEHFRHDAAAPRASDQRRLGFRRRRRSLDQRDDLVDVRERNGEPFEQVGAFARLAQVVYRATRDDFAPMTHERFDHFLEVEQARLAVDQRDHVDAEHRFHRRLLVEVVEDDLGVFVALQLDDDAHAVLVGLVAQLRDALDELAAHEVGDALDQPRLVHLVRQFGDDDGLAAVVVVFLDVGLGAHHDAAAARRVGVIDLARAVDDAGRREIRARARIP